MMIDDHAKARVRRLILCMLALMAALTLASWSPRAAAAGSGPTPLSAGLLQASQACFGRFPSGKKIVFTCEDGHRSMAAALFLNQLGYEAYDMRFGTLGWNDGTEGLGGAKEYLQSLGKSLDLPVEKGTGK